MIPDLSTVKEALIILGALPHQPEENAAILNWAEQQAWPIISDVQSNCRRPEHLIQCPSLWPECVIHIGGRLTGTELLRHLKERPPRHYIHITNQQSAYNPEALITHRITAAIPESLATITLPALPEQWTRSWNHTRSNTAQLTDIHFSEAIAISKILNNLPEENALFLANSLTIRLADRYLKHSPKNGSYANRGASGIDGLLATAAGICKAKKHALTVIIGDLAFFHDLNSLSLCRELPMQIWVLNNNGGGIFSQLPIAESPYFKDYFQTPIDCNIQAHAAAWSIPYSTVSSIEDLAEIQHDHSKASVVEVQIENTM